MTSELWQRNEVTDLVVAGIVHGEKRGQWRSVP